MNVRINNIECRLSQGRHEIVKWEPNDYYMKLHEYLLDGWYEQDGFVRNGNRSVQRSMFDAKEYCYTIATLEIDYKEPCIDLVSVGNRLLGLTAKERMIFFEVYEIAQRMIEAEHEFSNENIF